jgi:hypothetical protein
VTRGGLDEAFQQAEHHMRDGRYEADFGTTLGVGKALLTLRDGAFTGVTERGIPLEGWIKQDPVRNLLTFELNAMIPPHTDTLTGLSTGEAGRRVVVRSEKAMGEGGNRFSFGFAGRAVDVALRYTGPLED